MANQARSREKLKTYLGAKADSLLGFKSAEDRQGAPASSPARTFVDRIYAVTDRNPTRAHKSASACSATGRLSGNGLPLDPCPSTKASNTPGGASFAKNPDYFDGGNIVKLAVERAVATPSLPPSVCLGLRRAQVRSQKSPFNRKDQSQ